MIKTNRAQLVMQSIQGSIAPPVKSHGFSVDYQGRPFILPGVGGITYNIKVGDPACGWAADHVEPGVSMAANIDNRRDGKNSGLNVLACVGNKARVISGDAKGALGTVTGTHGGIEHVLVDFADDDLEKMAIDDKILIKAYGQGLRLCDYPDVTAFNIDPDLLEKLGLVEKGGRLLVPVAAKIPGKLMGSGIGSSDVASGDYDITTQDPEEVKRLGLDRLKLGDLVALEDADNTYGRSYRNGAMSIGVVVHSDCLLAGHGPGVTTVLTSVKPVLEPVVEAGANIAVYLGIGRSRA
ncbi:MAG TPA: DUF4438 domain-containing protein [Firmicutes bacterium]|nr:DUF4438 domain-containing protein [Bacillota bacterium]